MFKNYFKIFTRNLSRNKAFSIINIFGLAVGLTTCILIMLYIFSEIGYEQQFKDSSRIYRIGSKVSSGTGQKDKPWAATSGPVAWGLKADLPEVEEATRLLKFPLFDKMLLRYTNKDKESKQFYETNGYYVDSTFFRIFNYGFEFGNPQTALNEPNSVVISEEVAEKMFGNTNPLGKIISIGIPYGNFDYTVKGVFKDKDIKSHFPAHLYLSMRNGDIGTWVDNQTNWATNNIFHTYFKLKKGIDPEIFEKKLNPFMDSRGGTDQKAMGVRHALFMQPLQDIYLHSDLDAELAPNGNATYLYILGSIALFVLLIACINFMNLSTARSEKRAKEVGVRKVVGAGKKSLIYLFVGESLCLSFLALIIAVFLTIFLLPFFNNLTQKDLHFVDKPLIWLWIASLTMITGVLAGLYPAFYLSSFQPIKVLKGRLLNNFSAKAIRKGLVIFQFSISICLVLGAMVIRSQLNFLDNQSLGFNKSQQVILPLQSGDAMKNYTALKNELLKTPGIKSVTSGSTYPGITNVEDLLFYAEGKTINDVVDIRLASVGDDYFETLGISILRGRGFSKDFTADSTNIVVNEAALKEMGYDLNTAVGKKLYYDFKGTHAGMQIIGVVKNFNFESLYNSIKPFAFNNVFGNRYSYLIANTGTKDYAGLLKDMENAWNRINPSSPFVYSFLDKDFQRNYEKDQRASSIVGYFTGIAILIACLGLFGLAAFFAEQRSKEVGIRKALGASAFSVAFLLSKNFIQLVFIAILIASPLAWTVMNKWLENFNPSYRIQVSWWMFAVAGFLALFIAIITVSFQSIKAGLSNPVKALKSE